MAKVEIRGLDKLQKKLKKNCSLEDVKTVVLKNGMDMQNKTVKNAVFTKGIQQEQPKEVSEVKHVIADSHMQKDHQHIMHLMLNLEHVLWTHNLLLGLRLNNKYQYSSQI